MKRLKDNFKKIGQFYMDGFKGMTWGRPLWILIFLKIFILFAVFRLFFFKPVLGGKTDEQKSEYVGTMLTVPASTAAETVPSDTGDTIEITDTNQPKP